MNIITSQLRNMPPSTNTRSYPNVAGNCPEFITWGIVCRDKGKYSSLCVNMEDDPNGKIYKCCPSCEDILNILNANNIEIDDLWLTSVLGHSNPVYSVTYPYRKLKSLEVILAEFGR